MSTPTTTLDLTGDTDPTISPSAPAGTDPTGPAGSDAVEPGGTRSDRSDRHGRLVSAMASDAFSTVVLVASLYSYCRGYITDVQDWGEPFFYLDYSSGPIKRGLLGQLFALVLDRHDIGAMTRTIQTLHLAAGALLMYVMVDSVRSTFRAGSPDRAWANGILLVFAGSQFLPTAAYNVGYFDLHVFTVFVVAALLVPPDRVLMSSALFAVAILIHESALFFFASLAVLQLLRAALTGRLGAGLVARMAALPLATAAALYLLHSDSAAATELAEAPGAPELKQFILDVHFGQTLTSASAYMADKWSINTTSGMVATAYYVAPAAVVLALYWLWRRPRPVVLAGLAVSGAIPFAILLIAWDLSRFLVPLVLTTVVAVLRWERTGPPAAPTEPVTSPARVLPAVVVLSAVLLALPLTYSYFEVTHLINGELSPSFVNDLPMELLN